MGRLNSQSLAVLALALFVACSPDTDTSFQPRVRLKANAVLELLVVVDMESDAELAELADREFKNIESGETKPSDLLFNEDNEAVGQWIRLARSQDANGKIENRFKLVPQLSHFVRNADTGEVIDLKLAPQTIFGAADPGAKFFQWLQKKGITNVEVLCKKPREKETFTGSHIRLVLPNYDASGRTSIAFETTADGARRLGLLTSKNRGSNLAIVVDREIQSAPVINDPIFNRGTIEGNFTEAEVAELTLNLRSLAVEKVD